MLLAIDPSKHQLGYAKFLDGNLMHVDTHSFSHCPDLRSFLAAYEKWFRDTSRDCTHLAYEESRPRSMRHAEQHYGMIALIHLRSQGKTIVPVNWSTAKKQLAGSGRASKADMLAAAQRQYPMFKVDSHDKADAIAVGLVALDVLDARPEELVNVLPEEHDHANDPT